jgi:N-acetylmuramoyl-L-alanine amidase
MDPFFRHPVARMSFSKRHLPVLSIAIILLTVITWFISRPTIPPVSQKPEPASALSLLVATPDWSSLEPYQNSITREDFERLLASTFSTGEAWKKFIIISETEALIQTGDPAPRDVFKLHFSSTALSLVAPRSWKTAGELPLTPQARPLAGLRIAIDPGHIGGAWAKMEERWLVVGSGTPVCEGDMTLQVAQLLKPHLEALGASVSLVRSNNEPVTQLRPSGPGKEAERQFYRTAEIHARAKLVNETLKPDLVLCLHFNAEAWGNPTQPTLIDRTHLHLILNGAYTDEELFLPDQRLAMLKKLLSRTHEEEILVGSQLAATFSEITGLPPYQYPADTKNALPVPNQPYLWTRNLLANRLYDCPVIYLEPYVMNSTIDYPRLQAGDYDGLREINGKPQTSIFREYANALAQGLVAHYSKKRSF